ncbi:hypothetical protein B296_00006783 [Ensete ventricosum]|uniref:Uncharacterized protein n=1 Tax=Ensete ventricosum TaxID=4639 RepID=A0A427B5M4_ENSVE|nr:hypothetical protein B296_00006783 [Ensete ventricosum]
MGHPKGRLRPPPPPTPIAEAALIIPCPRDPFSIDQSPALGFHRQREKHRVKIRRRGRTPETNEDRKELDGEEGKRKQQGRECVAMEGYMDWVSAGIPRSHS